MLKSYVSIIRVIMNEKIKKVGAYGTLSAMTMGLLYNAYGQVKVNQIDIARLQEREKSMKELVLRVEKKVDRNFETIKGLK